MGSNKKIGLALGGGGARGLAHIGVLKALEAANIPIHAIAGTSMGALVGAWYALNKNTRGLEEVFSEIREKDMDSITKILWKRDGAIFKNKTITKIVEEGFGNKEFKDCTIPFAVVATDVRTGDRVVLKEGSLSEAAHASVAIPIIFPPVESHGKLLMDGGLCDPVPADVVKSMGVDIVIAVDVTSGWVNISENSINMLDVYNLVDKVIIAIEHQIAHESLGKADMVLRPTVSRFNWLDFPQAKEIIRLGEEETRRNLKEIYSKTGYVAPTKTIFDKFVDFLLYRE